MREPRRFVAVPQDRWGRRPAGGVERTPPGGVERRPSGGVDAGALVGPAPAAGQAAATLTRDAEGLVGGDCLLVTRDDALADHVALVAAAAGAALHVARDASGAPPEPGNVLLLGPDAALADIALRTGGPVILVGYAESEDALWRVAARRPGSRVAVLPRAAAWLGEFLGELGLRGGQGRVLLVAGTAGGAGTTTVAALAAGSATLDGSRTLLIDADPHSPGLWPVLRPESSGMVGWEDLSRSRGQVAPAQLAEILPLAQGTAVLTWSAREPGRHLPVQVLGEVVAAARRIYDVVVVDGGRSAGLDAALVAVADRGLAVVPARSGTAAGWLLGPHGSALPWGAVVTGRLHPGSDASRVAAGFGLEAVCFFPESKAVGAACAEGRLLAVLGRRALRSAVRPLVAACRAPAAVPVTGRVA